MNDKPKFPRLLICEGPKDHHFFDSFLEQRPTIPRFHILDACGNRNITGTMSDFRLKKPKTLSQIRKVLVVADNDEDPDESLRQIEVQVRKIFGAAPNTNGQTVVGREGRSITILMVPWRESAGKIESEKGHLEKLCVASARSADNKIGGDTDSFLALIGAERWKNDSRFGKAWLRSNLAARCENDPFVPLGRVFHEYKELIPLTHPSFNPLANFLTTVGS